MKVTIIGSLCKEGTSTKSGTAKPYSIGELYMMIPFSERDQGAKGCTSLTRKCSVDIIKRIQHLPYPLEVDMEVRDVIVYGKPEVEVVDLRPIQRVAEVKKVA
jgi:hypothetical protein